MTRLECTVASCVHNSEKCCCKQGILVEGVNARESCDTCCGSFEENRGGLFKNLFKTPETRLQVDCDVLNCLYNDDHQCRGPADNRALYQFPGRRSQGCWADGVRQLQRTVGREKGDGDSAGGRGQEPRAALAESFF